MNTTELYKNALSEFFNDNLNKTTSYLSDLLSHEPNNSKFLNALAVTLFSTANKAFAKDNIREVLLNKSLELINKAIKEDEKNYLLYFNRGNIFFELKKEEEAYLDFKTLIELIYFKKDINDYFFIGKTELSLNKPKNIVLSKCYEFFGDQQLNYVNYTKAKEFYQKAFDINSKNEVDLLHKINLCLQEIQNSKNILLNRTDLTNEFLPLKIYNKQLPNILIASAFTPIAMAKYYENAFRKYANVITCGYSFSINDYNVWKLEDEKSVFKCETDYLDKILALSKVADIPLPNKSIDIEELLTMLPKNWKPDLIVWIDNNSQFVFNYMDSFSKYKAITILMDTHANMHELNCKLDYSKYFFKSYISHRQHISDAKKIGIKNVDWLPFACAPEFHWNNNTQKNFDISFIGQTNPIFYHKRVNLLQRIQKKFNLNVTNKILNEMSETLSKSRIVFNKSLNNDLNMRVFEALCSGSLLITDRLTVNTGIYELFQNKKNIVFYDDDDLEEIIEYYLNNNLEREKIALQGQKEVLLKHTYEHRVLKILNDFDLL